MDSPSRNPLLLDQTNDDNSSGDESNQEAPGSISGTNHANHSAVKESYRRSSSTPTDRYNFAYIAFYILGMWVKVSSQHRVSLWIIDLFFVRTTLLPWNFFITAEEYWQYKFRNLTSNNSDILTPRQIQFQPDLAMCSAIPTTIFLILNAFYSHKWVHHYPHCLLIDVNELNFRISLKLRMVGSIIVILVLFIVTTAFVKVDTDNYQDVSRRQMQIELL